MNNRKKQFNSDLDWGKWGESTMWPWIENLFTRNGNKVSYWYDSDYQYKNLKGKEWRLKLK